MNFSLLVLLTLGQLSGNPQRAVYFTGYVTATTAVGTFYVDPTGNDTNACTSAGTGACLTVGGALAKLPTAIQHAQTINVAAGTYTEGIDVNKQMSANVNITGPALTNVTPTTGTATGALTSVELTTPVTLTDSLQTWTINNFTGRFMVMTSGAANGQARAIAVNTATSITLASPFTATVAAADTYAIQTPAVIITRANAGLNTFTLRLLGLATSSFIFTNISIEHSQTSSVACVFAGGGPATISMLNTRCVGGAGSGNGVTWNGGGTLATGSVSTQAAVIMGGQGLRVQAAGGSQPNGGGCRMQFSHLLSVGQFSGTNAAGISLESFPGACQWSITGGVTAQTASTSAGEAAMVVQIPLYASNTTTPFVTRCSAGGSNGIINNNPVTNTSYLSQAVRANFGTVFVLGCQSGVVVNDSAGTFSISSRLDCGGVAGTCVSVKDGARVQLGATFNTDAGTDISIDAVTYTKANLTGATPTRLPTAATVLVTPNLTGSTVWQ